MLVQRDFNLAQVREMLVLVRDMLANARRCHGDARHATTARFYRLVEIALNNRGT